VATDDERIFLNATHKLRILEIGRWISSRTKLVLVGQVFDKRFSSFPKVEAIFFVFRGLDLCGVILFENARRTTSSELHFFPGYNHLSCQDHGLCLGRSMSGIFFNRLKGWTYQKSPSNSNHHWSWSWKARFACIFQIWHRWPRLSWHGGGGGLILK